MRGSKLLASLLALLALCNLSIADAQTFRPGRASGFRSGFSFLSVAGAASQQVILAVLAGQSNIQGRNAQDNLDPSTISGVFQLVENSSAAGYQTLSSTLVPLQFTEGLDRVGPGGTFLQQLKADNPNAIIIAVPVSVGSTAMVGGTSPRWAPSATPGGGGDLFEAMINETNRARSLALAAYPGAAIDVRIHYNQGEQDASQGVSKAAYLSALSNFVSAARSRITDAANAPIMLGSMVPEKWAIGDPNRDLAYVAINEAQVAASITIAGVRYVVGPLYVSGSRDFLHYQPVDRARALGTRMANAYTDVTGPTMTSPASTSSTAGRPLSFAVTANDQHQTFEIAGGANASQFELSDPYISPALRWTSNSNGPAAGNYVVNVRPRDGSGNFGAAQAVTVTVAAVGQVSPTTFFTSGERGMVWDPSDLSTLFQDVAGTVPVTAAGQPVGRMLDKSPNANHWVAAADNTTRPTYQVDSDGKGYLQFDGSNDVLLAATPFHTATNVAMTSSVGLFGAAQPATKSLIAANSTTSATPFLVPFQSNGATGDLRVQARNDGNGNTGTVPILTLLDSTKRVATVFYGGGNQLTGIRSAAGRPTSGGTKTAGNYTTATVGTFSGPITTTRAGLGANSSATPANFYAGRIYAGYVINRVLTDAEIANGEDWIAARTMTAPLP